MTYRFRLITDTSEDQLEVRLNIFIQELQDGGIVTRPGRLQTHYSCSGFGPGVMYSCLLRFEIENDFSAKLYDKNQSSRMSYKEKNDLQSQLDSAKHVKSLWEGLPGAKE